MSKKNIKYQSKITRSVVIDPIGLIPRELNL